MNKSNLIEKLTEVLDSKKDAEAAVKCMLESVTKALVNNESVTLIGFGTFKTIYREARKGRNPQTGKEIDIPAKNVPKFVPGKALKEAVNPE